MGVVFRAQDELLRREVAIKLLPAVSAGNPERRQRFLREARVAASLVHPNVAVVHHVGESHGRVYIAMELVDGVTLRRRLEAGPLPVPSVRDLALQIAQGLAAAHAKGIVHRDLKPENVMVTSSGGVKLLDFGLAKSGWVSDSDSALGSADTEAQITREGDVLGSSAYMSPEQALGMSIDTRSDVFSFGIVLYEMLAGRRPFGGKSLGEIRAAIAREPPAPLGAAVDPEIARIPMNSLGKRAEERYADAGVIVLELVALDSVSASVARAGSMAPPAPRPRARLIARGVIAGALAAVIAASFFAMRHRGAAAAPSAASRSLLADADAAVAAAESRIDDGANPSTDPAAQRLYESALVAELNASCEAAATFLKRAILVDPSIAGAYLRLSQVGNDCQVPYFQRAASLEPTMSPRDKTLMSVVEATFTGTDRKAAIALAEKYLERYPRDAWMWTARISIAFDGDEGPPQYLSLLDRAIDENPSSAVFRGWKANEQLSLGDVGAARETADACLARAPRAAECLWAHVRVENKTGACRDFEADARRWLFLEPESLRARKNFAEAIASNGAAPEAVRAALGPAGAPSDGYDRTVLFLVPFSEGDFQEAERVAEGQLRESIDSPDAYAHFAPALQLVVAYFESGDVASASRVANDFLAHGAAWGEGRRSLLLERIRGADAQCDRGRRKNLPRRGGGTTALPLRPGEIEGAVGERCLVERVCGAETTVQAQDALEAFDRLGLSANEPDFAELFARAGVGERARAPLLAMAHECALLTQVRRDPSRRARPRTPR